MKINSNYSSQKFGNIVEKPSFKKYTDEKLQNYFDNIRTAILHETEQERVDLHIGGDKKSGGAIVEIRRNVEDTDSFIEKLLITLLKYAPINNGVKIPKEESTNGLQKYLTYLIRMK